MLFNMASEITKKAIFASRHLGVSVVPPFSVGLLGGTASADDAVAGGVVQHGERQVDILHLTKMAVPAMSFFCILIN